MFRHATPRTTIPRYRMAAQTRYKGIEIPTGILGRCCARLPARISPPGVHFARSTCDGAISRPLVAQLRKTHDENLKFDKWFRCSLLQYYFVYLDSGAIMRHAFLFRCQQKTGSELRKACCETELPANWNGCDLQRPVGFILASSWRNEPTQQLEIVRCGPQLCVPCVKFSMCSAFS